MQEETTMQTATNTAIAEKEAARETAIEIAETARANDRKQALKKARGKKRHIKLIVWGIIVLLVAGYIGFGMYQKATFIPTVQAGEVSTQDITSTLNTTATIMSPDSSSYFAPPNSKALTVNFKLGDKVKAGDIIATYDLTDLQNQISLAQIAYSDAQVAYNNAVTAKANAELGVENAQAANSDVLKSDEEREKEIDDLTRDIQTYNSILRKIEDKGGPPDNIADTEAQRYMLVQNKLTRAITERDALQSTVTEDSTITQSKNAIANADNALKSATNSITSANNAMKSASINISSLKKYEETSAIVAETDGIITEMNLVEGGTSPMTTACTIQTTENLKGTFNIGKYDLGSIAAGQPVVLTLGELTYKGTVSKIGSAAVKTPNASGTGTSMAQVPAEVSIENPDERLVIGLDFDMDIQTASKTGVTSVPVEALLVDRDGDYCYKLTPSDKPNVYTHEKVYVESGVSSDTYIEILSGLTSGDKILISPPAMIETMPIVQVPPAPVVPAPAE